jgi:hypothetical protein
MRPWRTHSESPTACHGTGSGPGGRARGDRRDGWRFAPFDARHTGGGSALHRKRLRRANPVWGLGGPPGHGVVLFQIVWDAALNRSLPPKPHRKPPLSAVFRPGRLEAIEEIRGERAKARRRRTDPPARAPWSPLESAGATSTPPTSSRSATRTRASPGVRISVIRVVVDLMIRVLLCPQIASRTTIIIMYVCIE